MKEKFCSQCGAALPDTAKFCPGCGRNLSAAPAAVSQGFRRPPLKVLVGILAVSGLVWGIGWKMQEAHAGKKPTTSYDEMLAKKDTSTNDSALNRLREAAKKTPEDINAWRVLAEQLFGKLDETSAPSQSLVLETIDVLREILRLDSKDIFALRGMADVSLNQQIFPEAVKYFERYLAIEPADNSARARYASALSFSGKSDQAVAELNGILKQEPNNFHAAAYLAVTHAQRGDKQKAIQAGERALKLAPSEEARVKFGEFLDQVRNGKPKAAPNEAQPAAARTTEVKSSPETVSTNFGIGIVNAFIQENPVAGRKFARGEIEGSNAHLYFNEFPMDKMPPAIRDKFVNSIVQKAQTALAKEVTTLKFFDAASGQVMVEKSLR